MAEYFVGTAGWSYEDWEGVVYPAAKPRGFHALSYLPAFIDIVEVNSTFYRPAPPAMVRSWLKRLEGRPGFLLSLKLYQAFTHAREGFGRKDVDDVRRAADLVRLGGRLAALLVQFPWSFRNTPGNRDYLRRLLETLAGYPLAVEVRHAGWDEPSFYGLLEERGAAFCNIDQPVIGESIGPSAVSTTPDFAYVRLHGRNSKNWFREGAGRDDRYDYLYARDELGDWVSRIEQLGRASGKVYIVANNHYRGQAMANALQLRNMLTGEKVDVPEPLLEKYPVLRDIVRAVEAGRRGLFDEGRTGGPGDRGGTS
ncbi:MAG TPA: DUF72 domain-containing protein [Candidatus Aminicenantes bacterium]|nr:DUF72 domain-containing protein [Candidatus Aminicenantes bacterium]